MPSLWFILLVSIASRLIWSRRFPFQGLRYEVNYMALIVFLNVIWFFFCYLVFGIRFEA